MTKFHYLLLFTFGFLCECHLGTMIPPPTSLSPDTAKCLIAAKHHFTIIRASMTDGKVDPNVVRNYNAAKAAGFQNIDLLISPCITCEPATIIQEMISATKDLGATRIWINVDVPGWREFRSFNQVFLGDLIDEITKAGKKAGVLVSKFQWNDVFGEDFAGASAQELAYVRLNKKATFKDFEPFGGWTKPYAKHYESDAVLCKEKMNLVYKEDV